MTDIKDFFIASNTVHHAPEYDSKVLSTLIRTIEAFTRVTYQSVYLIDYYRQGREIILVAVFVIVLVAFSGLRGIRMILSFVFAFLSIWKMLIPSVLKGANPLLMCRDQITRRTQTPFIFL